MIEKQKKPNEITEKYKNRTRSRLQHLVNQLNLTMKLNKLSDNPLIS